MFKLIKLGLYQIYKFKIILFLFRLFDHFTDYVLLFWLNTGFTTTLDVLPKHYRVYLKIRHCPYFLIYLILLFLKCAIRQVLEQFLAYKLQAQTTGTAPTSFVLIFCFHVTQIILTCTFHLPVLYSNYSTSRDDESGSMIQV